MKNICTAIALLMTCVATAQTVNIPDPAFKNELLSYFPVIDINHDGEIQVSEALAVRNLYLYSTDITGIREFANLDSLVSNGNTPNLDLSNMTHLRTLTVWASGSLNITGCVNLEYLNFGLNDVPDVTINLPRLKVINCLGQHVGNMILAGCDSLRKISLNAFGQEINKLDISGISQIDSITDFSSIHRLIARNCTGLKVIRANFTGTVNDELDVTGCINLKTIILVEIYFQELDLSTCHNLKIFMIAGQSANLQNLNIKNGRQLDSIYLFCSTAPTTALYVCADDFEVDSVSHMIARNYNLLFPRPFSINSYCSFFPGGSYNTIKGKARLDLNNNGCDIADAGMPNVPIRFTEANGQTIIRYTQSTGDYYAYTYKGSFTLQPYFPYPYFGINPTTATVNFDTANNLINNTDFCISPNGIHNDLEITFLPVSPARPGFDARYRLVYWNRGSTTLSGNVQVNFDNSRMNFISSTTIPDSQSPGQLSWNYNNLLPFERRTIDLVLNLLPPPANNINDTLTYLAVVNPVMGDETPADNSFILPQRVIGSFDPNDKQCLEGSKLAITAVDKYLHYMIRFQNMGTDTAFNIVVVDTLSNKLDWNTVELISSSHTCDIKQSNGILQFYFKDIKLPYQSINDPASNGFVAFKIKPKNTVSMGDSLNNKAAIYFDYNLPVITNMASTIVTPVSPIPVKIEYFSGSKQQTKNLLTWKAPSTNGSTDFSIERSGDGVNFSSIGNITATYERCLLPFNFTDNNPLAGKNYYRLKITDVDRLSFYSKTLLIENSKAGFEILSTVSNPANTLVYVNSSKQQIVQLSIMAADGKTIYNSSKTIPAGNSYISLPLNRIATGIYNLVIYTNETEPVTRRFVK